jgi:carbonic anhydrase/acetyltransferase-like protein (isoleucine patch superfamily)
LSQAQPEVTTPVEDVTIPDAAEVIGAVIDSPAFIHMTSSLPFSFFQD